VQDDVAAGARALKIECQTGPGQLAALIKDITGLPLGQMQGLSFMMKSAASTQLLVSLEELDKSRYQTLLQVQGGGPWLTHILDLSQFSLGDDSTDENGQLDPDQLAMLTFADVSALLGGGGPNTLWLDELIVMLR
jgi:hypothetical protein